MNNQQQGSYPPNPGAYPPTQGGYPPQGGNPYPPQGGNPYPPQGGNPYPPQGGNPYPPQGGASYPGSSPGYPPEPGSSPYPAAPGGNPFGGTPYPPAPGGNPYPPGPGAAPYPVPGGNPYPSAGGTGYPPQGGGYAPPGGAYPPQPQGGAYPPQPQGGAYPPQPQGGAYPPQNPYQQQQSQNYNTSSASTPSAVYGSSLPYTEIPTVKSNALFDPSSDAAALRKAMKGFGTDEKAIIGILARRTSYQRQQISQRYTQSYGKDLIKDLKSELSGNFETVILAMMTPLPQFLAKECRDAITGIGTNERTLVEILCTRDNASLKEIKDAYQFLFKKPVQNDIRGDTSGHFERLLVSICTAFREEGPCNPTLAPGIAEQLYKAGEGKTGTNEGEFNRILATYSFELLRCVFAEYQKIKGKSFGDALDAELSGDLKLGMKAIYMSIQNRAGYFAKEIHDSMAGMGTKDKALIRLIVSRSEIDMVNIKQEYQKMYHKPLEKDIKGDVSGHLETLLLALVEE